MLKITLFILSAFSFEENIEGCTGSVDTMCFYFYFFFSLFFFFRRN